MIDMGKHTDLHVQAQVGLLNYLIGYSYANLSLVGKGFNRFKCVGLGFSGRRT